MTNCEQNPLVDLIIVCMILSQFMARCLPKSLEDSSLMFGELRTGLSPYRETPMIRYWRDHRLLEISSYETEALFFFWFGSMDPWVDAVSRNIYWWRFNCSNNDTQCSPVERRCAATRMRRLEFVQDCFRFCAWRRCSSTTHFSFAILPLFLFRPQHPCSRRPSRKPSRPTMQRPTRLWQLEPPMEQQRQLNRP